MQATPNTGNTGDSENVGRPAFENPFCLDDLLIFDDDALRYLLTQGPLAGRLDTLALALGGVASPTLHARIQLALPSPQRGGFRQAIQQAQTALGVSDSARGADGAPLAHEIQQARRDVLDSLFWELTYWKTPELYEALTEGEYIHPLVFRSLAPWLAGATVLDVGAGTGRATFACLRQGARCVLAAEPSPGLRGILRHKAAALGADPYVEAMPGRFDSLPLAAGSVDVSVSCSAFTTEPAQGGEAGLAELLRVTRQGGHIVVIWPRPCDHEWFAAHGFTYVTLPTEAEMRVRFRSRWLALACARRFYGRNAAVLRYLARHETTELPFSVLGVNPPQDYYALTVEA